VSTTEIIKHLSARTKRICESCGAKAQVQLEDKSTWCDECDGAARKSGY
jgi:predicted nucleic acid-binding Zn ribbon protein